MFALACRCDGRVPSACRLRSLPDSFSRLTALVELFLTDNCLTELPAGIGACTSLVKLQVSPHERWSAWVCGPFTPLQSCARLPLLQHRQLYITQVTWCSCCRCNSRSSYLLGAC
jgi:hypothetical protein